MGTRCDFWIGVGKDAEWIGSIGMDGYVEAVPALAQEASDADDFRHHVMAHLGAEKDGGNAVAFKADGWQWPWEDSRVSDNSVWFHEGIVYFERGDWLIPFNQLADSEEVEPWEVHGAFKPVWDAMPNMLESERALYGKSRKGARDVGGGPMIIRVPPS